MSEERVPTAAELKVLEAFKFDGHSSYYLLTDLLPAAEVESCAQAGWIARGHKGWIGWASLTKSGMVVLVRARAGTATLAHLRSLLAEMERGEAARREFARLVIQGAELLDRAGDVALVRDSYLSEDGDNYISLNAYNLPAHIRSIYERSGGRSGEILVIIMPAPKDGGPV